jgi:trehalose utilization protein
MPAPHTRRDFLATSTAAVGAGLLFAGPADGSDKPVRVVVWDEQQPAQKEAYENFLGNWIARYLESRPGLAVKSVKLDDPGHGMSDEVLDACDVLVWWGHVRNKDVSPEAGRRVVDRIVAGRLSLIALHSAHWSTPFVEAMNERTRRDAEKRYPPGGPEKVEITFVPPAQRYTVPKADARLTPYDEVRKFPGGGIKVTVHQPVCCFPAYRADGKPSTIRVLKPDHPLVKDVPREFVLPHTEMYAEPFHVPEPDLVLLEERWASGDWFRSGCLWELGKGKVFYLRPGHETFAVYKEKPMLQLVENATRSLAGRAG